MPYNFTFYARGDSATANNGSINSQNTGTTPTTQLTFDVDGTASGDYLLEYNGGASDPDTVLYINGNTSDPHSFTVEFSGTLPTTNKFSNVNGEDLRGEPVTVITDDVTGQRYYFFHTREVSFATMDAMPNGAIPVGNVDSTTNVVVCFAAGTLIDTPDGPKAVESLKPGDLVDTDEGPMPVRWSGQRRLSLAELVCTPKMQPVEFLPGALGPDMPNRPLMVSPNHRMLVKSASLQLNLGLDQALAAAKHLVDGDRIRHRLPGDGITYCHILLDSHRLLTANGAQSESLLPGDQAFDALDQEARDEFSALFPELAQGAGPSAALPCLRAYEAAFAL